MSIGSTIKKIRREREMTQEQLAEYLGITANAVSQWECDRTAPDISQLPMLARVLRVTTDQLLGVDFDKDEAEIERILDESFDLYRAGQIQKAVEIARDGLKVYPNSFRLMARLAENLVGVKGCEEEMEGLCDKILKECTESRPREHAYRLKIVLCGQRGQYKEVRKLAENLPHVWAYHPEGQKACQSKPEQHAAHLFSAEDPQPCRHGRQPKQGVQAEGLPKISPKQGDPASGHATTGAGDPRQIAEGTEVIKEKQTKQRHAPQKEQAELLKALLFHVKTPRSSCGARRRRGTRCPRRPPR